MSASLSIVQKPHLLTRRRQGPSLGGTPSLALDFMTPGTLDPRLTFTRASIGTYTASTGTIQTAAVNAPRWEYDPATFALRGLLLEDARANIWLQSADASNAAWVKANGTVALPVVTANQSVAPDGTTTAARVAYPAVSAAGTWCHLNQGPTASAVPYAFSVWLKGAVGGEQLYMAATADAASFQRSLVTLTTSWQRFSLVTTALTAAPWYFLVGVDMRDAGQSSKPAQTIYVWGGQVELGGFATSYIPTAATAVTRAADRCIIPPANMGWFASPGGSWLAEFINNDTSIGKNIRIVGEPLAGQATTLFRNPTLNLGQYDGVAAMNGANTIAANVITKAASTWAPGTARACLNGGAIASAATLTSGYASMATNGVAFMQTNSGVDGTENMDGYLRNVRYWPRVLSDAEMLSVTR